MTRPYEPHIRTKEELDFIFPTSRAVTPIVDITDEIETRAKADMPAAESLADEQIVDAIDRLHEDTSRFPTFPPATLAAKIGPICPEDVVMVAARTGNGKSLFLMNVFDSWITEGRPVLYLGLEQSPHILRTKWACLRTGVAPRLVLAPKVEERGTPAWDDAMNRVQQDFLWQRSTDVKNLAHFSNARLIDARQLRRWVEWAIDLGVYLVIVDHIDRVQHGDGRNPFHELSATIRSAKELAYKHKIAIIMASQVSRPGDRLEQFIPLELHNMRGAGTKEEEADTVLGLYRPLRVDVTTKELKEFRLGTRGILSIIEPDTMGVNIPKHRLDGSVTGQIVRLFVRQQRLYDYTARDLWAMAGHVGRSR